jgi:hypothetical protein
MPASAATATPSAMNTMITPEVAAAHQGRF